MSKTVDDNVESFHYEVDLSIDPPLPDSKTNLIKNEYVTLRTTKDEDVQIVDGELKVVSNEVTTVVQNEIGVVYDYSGLKNAVKAIAKVASDAGANLTGQVIVKVYGEERIFRLRPDGSNLKVEAGTIAAVWPDGTTSPFTFGA